MQPPPTKYCLVSTPAPGVVLVTLNRAKDLNCVNGEGHVELDAIWSWLDAEPTLTCGIITGSGRAFSAGADLKGEHSKVFSTNICKC
jgi:enoyl-CoA hydratase/carnithine racemase